MAKRVATNLNNTLIGGKKRSRWHDEIWNIKYLHRYSCNFIYWFYLLRTCFKLFYNLPSVLVKKKKILLCGAKPWIYWGKVIMVETFKYVWAIFLFRVSIFKGLLGCYFMDSNCMFNEWRLYFEIHQ